MAIFLEEKRGTGMRALKRELTRLKNRRLRLLESGDERGLNAIERKIKSVRWRLNRTNERKRIIETELSDMEYLRMNHAYSEYAELKAQGETSIHVMWGVSWSELARWAKQQEEKIMATIKEQETLIAQQLEEIYALTKRNDELVKQNNELQSMAYNYDQQLQATDESLNASIDELAKVRAELAVAQQRVVAAEAKERAVRISLNEVLAENATATAELECVRSNFKRMQKDLQHTQDMLQREKSRSVTHQVTIKELENEIDEYAALVGNAEQQHNVLKQVAKPLLQQFINEM